MADGSESLLTCTVCFCPYNREEHAPFVGTCGHTLCSQCVKSLYPPNCPICRARESFARPTKNFLVYDLIEKGNLTERPDTSGLGQSAVSNNTPNNNNSKPKTNESRSFLSKVKNIMRRENAGTPEQKKEERPSPKQAEAINRPGPKEKSTILIIGGFTKERNRPYNAVIMHSGPTKWIELQLKLPYTSRGSSAVYLNEEIYIFGRQNPIFYKLDKNLDWIPLASMNIPRSGITNSCLVRNGYIWVFGGKGEDLGLINSVERYDPKLDKWTTITRMKYARHRAAAALWNDKIIVSGGYTAGGNTSTVECFNPENGRWTELPKLPAALNSHSMVVCNQKIIVMGGSGRDDEIRNTVYELDPAEQVPKWRALPPMPSLTAGFSGIVLGKRSEICTFGGCLWSDRGPEFMDKVQIFNGEQWRRGPSLPSKWMDTSAVVIPKHLATRLCGGKPK